MAKTIKQIADELGVSKTAVRQKIANLGLSDKTQTIGNRIMVTEKQEKLVKSTFYQNESQTENRKPVCEKSESFRLVSDMLEMMNRQLEEKDRQLAEKDKQIERLTAALENTTDGLKAAQALHAGTIQQQLTSESSESSEQANVKKKKRWWQR